MDNPVGIVSCHIGCASLEEAVDKAAAWGADGIEWFEYDKPGPTEPSAAARIVELSARRGMRATYHAPWGGRYDLGRLDRQAASRTIDELLERAGRIGARLMTLHLGSHGPAGRQAALDSLAAALNDSAESAAKRRVTICLENFTTCHGPTDLADRTADFEFLFGRIGSPAVGLNLDVGHANITGNLRELVERFGLRLRNTHLHDTDGKTDGHKAPGAGTIDWPALLALLKSAGYRGPLNYEFPQTPDGAFERLTRMIRRT